MTPPDLSRSHWHRTDSSELLITVTDQQDPPRAVALAAAAALQRDAAPAGVRLARLQGRGRSLDAHRPYPVQRRHLVVHPNVRS